MKQAKQKALFITTYISGSRLGGGTNTYTACSPIIKKTLTLHIKFLYDMTKLIIHVLFSFP